MRKKKKVKKDTEMGKLPEPKRHNNLLYWLPRVLMILFILFISLFALDVFGEDYAAPEFAVALVMHLLPTIFLVVLAIVAWKWEKIGGILIILLGLLFTLFFDTYENLISFLIISVPMFLVGILFLMDYHHNVKPKNPVCLVSLS